MSDDDADLFRKAMTGIRPLKPADRVANAKKKPLPRAAFSRADDDDVLRESLEADIDELEEYAGEAMRFHRPSVGKRTMRQLARGKFAVQDEIDLHGMTVAEARPRLADFIDYAAKSGKRCVRVVHGKGLGSGNRGPVLKPAVNRWLRRMDVVLAFVSTRQVDGGTGAIYVLLEN
ncbi:MAG: Smr/MutS family protein [Woeseiaceae bacterium]|nr:Smr/MutS family protein [Woeseiaceae bacterium]